jgi:uridine phosphorylase
MGAPSLCIVLPEAYLSGARTFIRVGSCGSLIKKSKPGDVIIVENALRLESTSSTYAPDDAPANADTFIVNALIAAAREHYPERWFVGIEATTDCFREGQGRPNAEGILTEYARKIHEYVLRSGAACYSMEASALFVWCATHFGGIPCGVINAVFANRITNEFAVAGEKEAARIALEAIRILCKQI